MFSSSVIQLLIKSKMNISVVSVFLSPHVKGYYLVNHLSALSCFRLAVMYLPLKILHQLTCIYNLHGEQRDVDQNFLPL